MKALKLAEELEEVLAGRRSMYAVLDNDEYWPEFNACNHGLHHFAMDDHIREKDSVYREMQEDELRYLISLLRSGASDSEIGKVHFLGRSKRGAQ